MARQRLGILHGHNEQRFFCLHPARPKLKLEIRRCGVERWGMYRRFHYLSSNLSTSARCYEATLDGKPVAFIGVLHQPGKITNMKRTTRLVVLPDYQGIGIGYALQTYIAQYYAKHGFVFHIITSARNFILRLAKSKDWRLTDWKLQSPDKKRKTVQDRKTAVYKYVGEGHVHSKQPSRLKMRNTRVKKK